MATKKNNKKNTIMEMLDEAVKSYYLFRNRDDYPDKPCVRREAATRQSAVFNLADYLCRYKFITWEQCCEYWAKVEITGDIEDKVCPFTNCGANIHGLCKYMIADTDEEIERVVDKFNEIPEVYPITPEELKKTS